MDSSLDWLLSSPILAPIVYAVILGIYLVVVPLLLFFYLKARWYVTGSWERTFICFMVFFFFPGMLILAPAFNFRPEARKI